jgi:coenzyme F420 biosynthesis associated uncharacterized protein
MSIDWATAELVAGLAAGTSPPGAPLHHDLVTVADRAAARVTEVTGLAPQHELPPVEVVDRATWARANVSTMRTTLEPAMRKATLPPGGGVLVGLETGALVGLMSRAVLGQYELSLLEPVASPRLLLVGPNLREGAEKMDVPVADLTAWVTYHEVCHAVQFTSVPWLRDHLGGLLRELLGSLSWKLEPGALRRLPELADLRNAWRSLSEAGLVGAVAGPERRALLDQVQATMSLVEGHAEHVMDVAAEGDLEGLADLREALDRRRVDRPPAMKLLFKLLGLEMKMRQYQQGREFVDAVVGLGGHEALNRAWADPANLPTLDELADAPAWLRRTERREAA